MKSQLAKFKKIKDKPLSDILHILHLSEERLYTLCHMWIDQGHLKKDDPIFTEIREHRQARRQHSIQNRREQELKAYQELRDADLTIGETAKRLRFSRLKMDHFFKKWYQTLSQQEQSDTEIAHILRVNTTHFENIRTEYEEEARLKLEARDRRLSANRLYADTHLAGIQEDLQRGTQRYLIFDIEAIQCPDEPIEISMIDCHGNTVFNQLIKPENKINWRIEKLTGITNDMVANQPNIHRVMPIIKELTQGRTLLSWGSDYDAVLFKTACEETGTDLKCTFGCAQRIHMGVLNSKNQIALGTAAGSDTQSHRALDDCLLVLDILKRDIALKGL